MKRTPLKRRTPLRRTGLPRRGTHLRAGQPRRRIPLRATKFGRARPDEPLATWCEARIPGVCTGRAEHRHHRLLRKHGGTDDRSNTTDLCRRCHGHVHANTGWAYSVGLLVHAWETAVETDLCPGTGHFPHAGTCPECGMPVELVAHPDGGPEGVAGEHGSTP